MLRACARTAPYLRQHEAAPLGVSTRPRRHAGEPADAAVLAGMRPAGGYMAGARRTAWRKSSCALRRRRRPRTGSSREICDGPRAGRGLTCSRSRAGVGLSDRSPARYGAARAWCAARVLGTCAALVVWNGGAPRARQRVLVSHHCHCSSKHQRRLYYMQGQNSGEKLLKTV